MEFPVAFNFKVATMKGAEMFMQLERSDLEREILAAIEHRNIYTIDESEIEYDIEEYKFNAERHRRMDNTRIAVESAGCGCSLCVARHNYAIANRSVSWLKKVYHSDSNHYLFEDLYWKQAHCEVGEPTEDEFYNIKLREYQATSGNLRTAFKEVEKLFKEQSLL